MKVNSLENPPIVENDHDRGRFWTGFDLGVIVGLGFNPGMDDPADLIREVRATGERLDPDAPSASAVLHTLADLLEDPGGFPDEASAIRDAIEREYE